MTSFDSDILSLHHAADLTRRGFAMTSLIAGFALATRPVSAAAITTDTEGLEAGEVQVPVKDGTVPAYRARPKAGGPAPVILVVQEIFGVHEHIKDICRRLAKIGYYAIATELYARQGDASKISDINQLISTIVSKVPDAQVMSDLDATAAFAAADGGDAARLGITGFCWGGRIVWLYAEHNPKLKAGVAWYGKLVGDPTPLQPRNPIDLVADLHAPVLGLYGGADTGIPVETVRRMESVAKAAGKTVEMVVYPDTPHAFNADYRPSYRQGPAEDGWKRLQAWFRAHGL
ncbi:dienelactone hydrolase family protein [Inquilinus limosus]|uniref:Carboxymethylenebutenolidase n=1 Tax=Inquilinus limosus TaxID=171674 RepID=A0A211ZJC6_9PROT|nr:dienelactone hydrolase family protein [Inquilinus limosus]OWJ65360.1 carboxymethylenebutenolidase [Inquilinus limosus]